MIDRRPSFLWALDAGTRRAGIALLDYETGSPREAHSLLTSRASVEDMIALLEEVTAGWSIVEAVLVSEWPRKYKSHSAAWDDVDGLREVVQRVEAFGSFVASRRVTPGVWKGHVPKNVHHLRIFERLTPSERARLDWPSLGPDGRDSVALGQWAAKNHGRLRLP